VSCIEDGQHFSCSIPIAAKSCLQIIQHISERKLFPENHVKKFGHAIAKAVNHWLLTAAAQVRARVWQVGFVVDKVVSGQVFSEYFGFPCQDHSFHQLLHHHNHPGQLAEAW
jgi:hypothetical protein